MSTRFYHGEALSNSEDKQDQMDDMIHHLTEVCFLKARTVLDDLTEFAEKISFSGEVYLHGDWSHKYIFNDGKLIDSVELEPSPFD